MVAEDKLSKNLIRMDIMTKSTELFENIGVRVFIKQQLHLFEPHLLLSLLLLQADKIQDKTQKHTFDSARGLSQ